jgi:Replication-relaxation
MQEKAYYNRRGLSRAPFPDRMASMVGVGPKGGRQKDYVVSLVDEAILRDLYQLHFVTAGQLTRLRYSQKSLNYVREQLKRLMDAGYLFRCNLPRSSSQGRAEGAYELAPPAIRYLDRRGFDVSTRPRPVLRPTGDQFLLHTLAGNDVLIEARLLSEHAPELTLEMIRHERDLRRVAAVTVKASASTGERQRESIFVVPDGWLDFRVTRVGDRPKQFPLWLEIDRATHAIKSFKRKVRGIIAYYDQGHYKRVFGTKFIRVAVIVDQVAAGNQWEDAARRRDAIVRWLEEELSRLGSDSYASIFAVTVLPRRGELPPGELFIQKRWLQPFSAQPFSLFDLPKSPPAR